MPKNLRASLSFAFRAKSRRLVAMTLRALPRSLSPGSQGRLPPGAFDSDGGSKKYVLN